MPSTGTRPPAANGTGRPTSVPFGGAKPGAWWLILSLVMLGTGCGDASTAEGSTSADAGGAAATGGNPDQTARCSEQCATSACANYPWTSEAECRRICEQFLEPEVPAACASSLASVAACETANFRVCEFRETPCSNYDCAPVCDTERAALGDCVRGAVTCEYQEWGLWWRTGGYTGTLAQVSLGIVYQWGCRCAGSRSGVPVGGACTQDEDCVSVCCSCPATPPAFGLQHCGADGRCAGTEACAAELAENGPLFCL
jgi:hypothetical protein